MPDFRTIDVGELKLRIAVQGTGPLVLMVHGFPESWFSWRHQLDPIAEAGFTAAAIDVRGYGGSDKPPAVADYAMQHMVADDAGAIQALSPDAPAVIIGHDWGAPIVWNSAGPALLTCAPSPRPSVPYTGVLPLGARDPRGDLHGARPVLLPALLPGRGRAAPSFRGRCSTSLSRFYYAISGDAPDGPPNDKVVGDPLLLRLPDPDLLAWLTGADARLLRRRVRAPGASACPLNRYRNHDRRLRLAAAVQQARRSSSRRCSSAANATRCCPCSRPRRPWWR